MPSLYTLEDGKLTLNLHPGQTKAWDSEKRYVFVLAGTQGGKTSFGPFWLWREITRLGGGDYLAVSSSFDLFQLKMMPEMRNLFIDILGIARYHGGIRVFELRDPVTGEFWAKTASDPMWGRIILRSAQSVGGLESATAKAAWLDEMGQDDFKLPAWEAIQRRLTLHSGRVLGTTTIYNLGWLKHMVYDPWERGKRPDTDIIQFSSVTNPAFPQSELDRAKRELPDWKFRMFYMGEYTRPAGMIYGDFDAKDKEKGGHKVEPFAIPIEWPRYVGVDPGAVNTAIIWIAHDVEHNHYYVYRTSLEGGMSTREHVDGALGVAKRMSENVIAWGVGAKSETQQRMDWIEAGIYAQEPPYHDVESGIDRIIMLLREHRLFFFNNLHDMFDEIGTYSRQLDDMGEAIEKIRDKAKYHRLDALRYGVAATTKIYSEAGGMDHGEEYSFNH